MNGIDVRAGTNVLDLSGGHQTGEGIRITLTGPNQLARRFIHPPTFTWQEVPGARRYRVSIAQGIELVDQIESERTEVDFGVCWDRVRLGWCRWLVEAFDGDGRLRGHSVTFSFARAKGFDGTFPPARRSYRETARQNLDFLFRRTGLGNYDPTLPPYVWHSTISNDTNSATKHNVAYPALHLPYGIDAFLDYRHGATDERTRAACLAEARQIADWLIAHSTPATDAYPYLPYQCVSNGRVGLHGGKPISSREQEGQSLVEPNKAGYAGYAYLKLFRETGEAAYRTAAERIAETLLRTQRPSGDWLYRVDSRTGESHGEDYTSTAIFSLYLLDELSQLSCDPRYRAARDRALQWLIDNPLTTFRWENIFDDTSYKPNYANLGNFDALFAGRFLLAHRAEDARFVPMCEALVRWIDDNFVFYGEDPVLPFVPYAPSVAEQTGYFWPMVGHNANWLLFLLPLYAATAREEHRRRAIGAANVITHSTMADGRATTYIADAVLGARGQRGTDDWYADTFWSIRAMLAIEPVAGREVTTQR